MKDSRTVNSIKNYVLAEMGQILTLVLKFIVRSVFIYTLSADFLGLSGLFSNILQVLSLAELGIGVAITYSLYRPIAENDEEQIIKIMRLFKKVYTVIGIIVLLVGSAITPFLKYLINDMPDIPNLSLIYILYVVNTGISYFYSYKATFISAKQRNYIVTNNQYLCNILCSAVQCLVLLLTHDYLFYLVTQVAFTLLTNIRISKIADREYPFLKRKVDGKLPESTIKEIKSNVGATFIHKVGSIIVFSTDNLLLSSMFGLTIVGLYSNYTLIVTALEGILNQFFTAITASVGNLGVSEDREHQINVYNIIFFVNFWMYSFATIGLGVLVQPFITLWVGDDYLMSSICVLFIVTNFYLKGMRQTNMTFLTSYGLAPKYKYMPILECLINLGASILLGKLFGPVGIFIGTTLSTLFTCFWIEPYILFKYGFDTFGLEIAKKDKARKSIILEKTPIILYVKDYILYTVFTVASYYLIVEIVNTLRLGTVIGFIIRCLLVVIVPNGLIVLLFHNSKEFKYLLNILNRLRRRSKNV